MVRHTQPLGDGILNAIGLDRVPGFSADVYRTIRDRLDALFDFTLTVSTQPDLPCETEAHGTRSSTPDGGAAGGKKRRAEDAGGTRPREGRRATPSKSRPAPEDEGEHDEEPHGETPSGHGHANASKSRPGRCCRMIINPGRDAWRMESPHVAGPDSETFEVKVAYGKGELTLSGSATTVPTLAGLTRRGECPGRCEDEALDIDVSVQLEIELTLTFVLQTSWGRSPGPVSFGPVLGTLDPRQTSISTYSFSVTRKLRKNTPYSYVADCARIRPARVPAGLGGGHTGDPSHVAAPGGVVPGTNVPYVPVDPHCPEPDGAEMVASDQLRRLIENCWTGSNPYAPDVPRGLPSPKREQGGWVIKNVQTGRFRIERRGGTHRDQLNCQPIPQVSYPECIWARVHTHPNTASEGYDEGWSNEDRKVHRTWRFSDGRRVPDLLRSHRGLHALYDDAQGNPVEVVP